MGFLGAYFKKGNFLFKSRLLFDFKILTTCPTDILGGIEISSA